jgi:peptidoglycan/LPS O-acetylase OafA/YrhL
MSRVKIGNQLSLALDLSRFIAALLVFVHHVSGFSLGYFWQVGRLSHEAVVFFFVLSGYVIAYVAADKRKTGEDYAVDRLTRIYSVAVPAILLTLLCDFIGHRISPIAYAMPGKNLVDPVLTIFSALSFTNQSWMPISIFSNMPYWSLGFEVWYYAFFGVMIFVKGFKKNLFALGILAIMGPSIILYLPVWLLGVVAYTIQKKFPAPAKLGAGIALASLLATGVFCIGSVQDTVNHACTGWVGVHFMGRLNETAIKFASDYFLGMSMAICIYSLPSFIEKRKFFPSWSENPIRIAASYTFSLYLFHMPLLFLVSALVPAEKNLPLNLFGALVVTPLIIVVLGYFTEQQKELFRRSIRKLISLGLGLARSR